MSLVAYDMDLILKASNFRIGHLTRSENETRALRQDHGDA